MKSLFGKVLAVLYSTVDAVAEAANTSLSILVSTTKRTKANYIIASFAGLAIGTIHWLTSYSFQGAEIRKNLSTNPLPEIEHTQGYYNLPKPTTRRSTAYLICKYGYGVSAIVANLFEVYLLASAAKAWGQDLEDGENNPLTIITPVEMSLIFLYYTAFNLPFILTNEIAQTWQQIRHSFNIAKNAVPDSHIVKRMNTYIKPLAKSSFFQNYIRIVGSITDTVEHVIPLIIIVPISWMLELASQPALISWSIGSVAAVVIAIVATTVLIQTYLFEGKYSQNNLRALAGQNQEENHAWLNPTASKIFHKFLYLGAPLHGIDLGLTILLAAKELGLEEPLAYFLAAIAFVIAAAGNLYSEVKASQQALQDITYSPRLFSHLVKRYQSLNPATPIAAINTDPVATPLLTYN